MASVLRVKDENGNWISVPAIQGKSAYELALRYGFKGTEAEWLESLPSKDVIVAADNSVARLEEKSAGVQAKVEAELANALSDIAEAKATMLEEIELAAEIVQKGGNSETAVMSQKATTDAVGGVCEFVGASHIIASGKADAVSPAYAETTIVSEITLKKGRGYRLDVSVATEDADKKNVWITLSENDSRITGFTIYTATADSGYVEFVAANDYDNARVYFATQPTSGYTISASVTQLPQLASERHFPNTVLNPADFVNGDPKFWAGGASIDYGFTHRVCSHIWIRHKYTQVVHLKADEGFRFAVGSYDSNDVLSDSGWQTEMVIPANQPFRLSISRITEDTSEIANVAEFVSKVTVFANILHTHEERLTSAEKAITGLGRNITDPLNIAPKPFEVLSINHRGFNRVAPENTLAAFKLSKKQGFDFVETDVRFTSDGVPVLLHDISINRTARNADGSEISSTINIADITYATALTYDFGIWKGAEYAGTKIPTLEEFMRLCRVLGLHPYFDLYDACSEAKSQKIYDTIKACGMEHNVTYVSSAYSALSYMAELAPNGRYGLVSWDTDPTTGLNASHWIDILKGKGVKNIFLSADLSTTNLSLFKALCEEKGVALEAYCPNTEAEILNLDPFITGVTSDTLIAKNVLRDGNID